MHDIKIKRENGLYDIEVDASDIAGTNGLETSVQMSIFAASRDDDTHNGGYWADYISSPQGDIFGSLLWKYGAETTAQSNLTRIAGEIKRAIEWLVEDSIAESVDVEVVESTHVRAEFLVRIVAPSGEVDGYSFFFFAAADSVGPTVVAVPEISLVPPVVIPETPIIPPVSPGDTLLWGIGKWGVNVWGQRP